MKLTKVREIQGIVPPKHHELLSRLLLDTPTSSKNLKVSFISMQAKGRSDAHIHEVENQFFLVLGGAMIMKISEGETRLEKGDAALVYPGEAHENYNVHGGETEYLVITY